MKILNILELDFNTDCNLKFMQPLCFLKAGKAIENASYIGFDICFIMLKLVNIHDRYSSGKQQ